MGTNFYLNSKHVGKSSAAGPYCWDCGLTLCREGEQLVHGYDFTTNHAQRPTWHDHCPECGQAPIDEEVGTGAIGVELGFATPPEERPKGVRSCASFTWATEPGRFLVHVLQEPEEADVLDEYGQSYTRWKFLKMLKNHCPIQFTHSIGQEFE